MTCMALISLQQLFHLRSKKQYWSWISRESEISFQVLYDMQHNYNLQFIYSTTKRIPAKLAVVRSQASTDILRCTICGDREYYHPAVAGSDLQSRFQLQRNSLLKSHRRAVDRIWEQGPSTGEYCKWNHSPFFANPESSLWILDKTKKAI